MDTFLAWWNEVIWYWVFAAFFIVGLSRFRVTLLSLMIGITVMGILVVLMIFAGVQPRING